MEILSSLLLAAVSSGIGAAVGILIGKRGQSDFTGALESLQREKEIAFRESVSLRTELDRLLREKEELQKSCEDEIAKRLRQLQVLMSENKRLSDSLSLLQLEKKSLENRVNALESRLRSSIPREVVRSVAEAEKLLSKIKEFIQTGEVKNYRLITSGEHDSVFARMFAEEEKVFVTSPFITEDAVAKRLPEIEAFLKRDGKLFLVLGREWNTVRFGDDGLINLMRCLSDAGKNVKVYADNIHHKVLAGEKTVVITSYNFLSKNNRLREIGIEIDDANLARKVIDLEIENLKNSQTVRRVTYKCFSVVGVESSTSGKTYRVETDLDDLPRIYFPLEIEPKIGKRYEAVIIQQFDGNYSQVIAAKETSA